MQWLSRPQDRGFLHQVEAQGSCSEEGRSLQQATAQGDGGRCDRHTEGEVGVFSLRHQEPFEQQVQDRRRPEGRRPEQVIQTELHISPPVHYLLSYPQSAEEDA